MSLAIRSPSTLGAGAFFLAVPEVLAAPVALAVPEVLAAPVALAAAAGADVAVGL